MNAFLISLSFLTRIPVSKINVTTEDWEKSSRYFPLIGLILGSLLVGCAYLLSFLFPQTITAALLLVFWIWLTGALHLDGWMDLSDGLGSSRPRDEMLVIMKDSRVGAMGSIAAILLLLVKVIAIYELISQSFSVILLLLPPFMARLLLMFTIKWWPYRSSNGLGFGLSKGFSTSSFIIYSLVAIVFLFWSFNFYGLIMIAITFLLFYLFTRSIYKKLGTLTGDCYGAIIEWVEVVTLLMLTASWQLFL